MLRLPQPRCLLMERHLGCGCIGKICQHTPIDSTLTPQQISHPWTPQTASSYLPSACSGLCRHWDLLAEGYLAEVAAAAVPPAQSAAGCSSPVQQIFRHQQRSAQAVHVYWGRPSRSVYLSLAYCMGFNVQRICNACAPSDQLMSSLGTAPTPRQLRIYPWRCGCIHWWPVRNPLLR